MTTDQLESLRQRRPATNPPRSVPLSRMQLEQAALEAHRRGDSWATFWPTVAADVAAVTGESSTPWGKGSEARRELVARLSHLVACGNTDGMTPAGDGKPSHVDDAQDVTIVSDIETRARCLWTPTTEAAAT